MDKLKSETLEREMFRAVEENHRRAVRMALGEREEPRVEEMPTWACVLWTVVLAALAVACLIYSMV